MSESGLKPSLGPKAYILLVWGCCMGSEIQLIIATSFSGNFIAPGSQRWGNDLNQIWGAKANHWRSQRLISNE